MKTTEKLKRCPFCDGELSSLTMCIEKRKINPDNVYVSCYHCGACGPSAWSKEEAIKNWNNRKCGE